MDCNTTVNNGTNSNNSSMRELLMKDITYLMNILIGLMKVMLMYMKPVGNVKILTYLSSK